VKGSYGSKEQKCSAIRNNASYEARMHMKVSMETGVQDGFLGYLLQIDLT